MIKKLPILFLRGSPFAFRFGAGESRAMAQVTRETSWRAWGKAAEPMNREKHLLQTNSRKLPDF